MMAGHVPPPPGESVAPPGRSGPSQVEQVFKAIVTWVRLESAATQSLVTAFIALGIAFQWWHWSNSETGAVIGIMTALFGMFVRSQVTPLIRPRTTERRLLPEGDPPPRASGRPGPGI
jgi:uncharacterized membrane protein YccC